MAVLRGPKDARCRAMHKMQVQGCDVRDGDAEVSSTLLLACHQSCLQLFIYTRSDGPQNDQI